MKNRIDTEDVSVKVTGEMTKKDAGKIAIINAWRKLIIDVVNHAIAKLILLLFGMWHSKELLYPIVKHYFEN